jgi:hypothetical protein
MNAAVASGDIAKTRIAIYIPTKLKRQLLQQEAVERFIAASRSRV